MIQANKYPGYYMAKSVINLINSAGKIINGDPEIGDLLKVVYVFYNILLRWSIH